MQNDPEFNIKFVQLVENYPVIYNQALDEYAHKDTTRKAWEDIAAALNESGAIDGTHIVIDPPKQFKDDYIDRKGNSSICLQAICDENKKFTDIFVGYPGSVHDSRVLQNSFIFPKLESICKADACIQKWRVLRGSYTRFLRTRPVGTCSAPGRRAYYLAKYMEFLLPHLKYKPQGENGFLDEFTEQETTSEAFETVKREFSSSFDDGQKSTTSFSDYESIPKEEPLILPQAPVIQQTPSFPEAAATIDFVRTRKRQKTVDEQSDPDMDFFKSILPDVKDLPQKKKYMFRMSVLKTISDLMENEDFKKES